MVDSRQLADHRHDPVGEAPIVGGHTRKVLHLPHDVVAQIAHKAAMQWREAV